ncbi:MAG: glutathione-disulfide reductase [Myxococcota bacterium]
MGKDYDFDLIVIGAGSGGVRAARRAASYGARVAICEDSDVGGTCVNVGCVPKKLFMYGSMFSQTIADAAGYGWKLTPEAFRWRTLVANKDREINRLNSIYETLLEQAGAQLLRGRGVVKGPHQVAVGSETYEAKHILIATGSFPFQLSIPGQEHAITSNEIFHLQELPERMVIIGGGYIAVEFASIFHELGVETTLVHRGDKLLRGFDEDVRDFVQNELEKKGLQIRLKTNLTGIQKQAGAEPGAPTLHTSFDIGSELTVGLVLTAVGRIPKTEGLGLRSLGVKLGTRGGVEVDSHYRSSIPSIFAIGDVIDRVQLTPIALAEGSIVARNLFDSAQETLSYEHIPTAVFCQPNVATVGLTEAEAQTKHEQITVYRSSFRPMQYTLTENQERSLMKLVVDDTSDKVLGCHMVGPHAAEIIQGLAVALQCGATKAQFDATLGIHPTAAEEFVTMRTPVPRP